MNRPLIAAQSLLAPYYVPLIFGAHWRFAAPLIAMMKPDEPHGHSHDHHPHHTHAHAHGHSHDHPHDHSHLSEQEVRVRALQSLLTAKGYIDPEAIDRIAAIHAAVPNTHLVMHGSSSVPQELLAIIRQYGGQMKETYGVPVEEIQEAIKHGVRKINIDTDIRLAMTAACRKFLFENPDKFDAREWLKPARAAAQAICKQRYLEFGCEGQGARIKGHSLSVMAQRYAKGELAQVVN